MSEQDIVRPIGNGKYALVWIESIETPRQPNDTFRLQIPVRASLCDADGTLEKDGEGNEIEVKSPLPSINAPFSHYEYHPDVQAHRAAARDIAIRIVRGDILPIVPSQENTP